MDSTTRMSLGHSPESLGKDRTSSPRARRVRNAAARKRASIARYRALGRGAGDGPGSASAHGPASAAIGRFETLSSDELDRRRTHAAIALVRTIRSVPLPGVAPFTRRDRLLFVALIAAEAIIVVLVAAAGGR